MFFFNFIASETIGRIFMRRGAQASRKAFREKNLLTYIFQTGCVLSLLSFSILCTDCRHYTYFYSLPLGSDNTFLMNILYK